MSALVHPGLVNNGFKFIHVHKGVQCDVDIDIWYY